jgi:hypothetical protein
VVHGDEGWEESDEAWELGEEEAMIVGTIQQEAEGSWQDACDAWVTQDEEAEAGVHQVGVGQEADEPAGGGQCKKANDVRDDMESPEVRDLLVEGEEQEYFLELLMRRESPEQSMENPPPRNEANVPKGRKNKNMGKKARGRKLLRETTGKEPKKEKVADPVGGEERQVASNLAHNPEAKGRGLVEKGQQEKGQAAQPAPTSGGECFG